MDNLPIVENLAKPVAVTINTIIEKLTIKKIQATHIIKAFDQLDAVKYEEET